VKTNVIAGSGNAKTKLHGGGASYRKVLFLSIFVPESAMVIYHADRTLAYVLRPSLEQSREYLVTSGVSSNIEPAGWFCRMKDGRAEAGASLEQELITYIQPQEFLSFVQNQIPTGDQTFPTEAQE
jgi:hypothetical protein